MCLGSAICVCFDFFVCVECLAKKGMYLNIYIHMFICTILIVITRMLLGVISLCLSMI